MTTTSKLLSHIVIAWSSSPSSPSPSPSSSRPALPSSFIPRQRREVAAGGAANSSCTQWYTVLPGDYCNTIAVAFNLTVSQIEAYNPALNASCDLSAGQQLCIAMSSSPSPSSPSPSSPFVVVAVVAVVAISIVQYRHQ